MGQRVLESLRCLHLVHTSKSLWPCAALPLLALCFVCEMAGPMGVQY